MKANPIYDAIVIGSGPNGLAAAIKIAQEGYSVALFEAKETIGGGMRSAELTLPEFIHDICSAIHPLAISSPFFRTLPLEKYGLKWIQPSAPLAHPFDDGTAALLERKIDATGSTLNVDADAYKKLMDPLVASWPMISNDILAPFHLPKHPLALAKFGILGIRSAIGLSNSLFKGNHARGLFAGLAAHSIMPLEKPLTAAFGIILCILGHTAGWPIAEGGSQMIANSLADHFRSLGGMIFTNSPVESIDQLPSSKVILCDIGPKQLRQIAGHRLPSGFNQKLANYRYGPGIFKVDWALSEEIPWKASACRRAGTIHIGGSAEEIEQSEREAWQGIHAEKPYVLMAQQSLFDSKRAPHGKQTAWGYCHVPHGSTVDMTTRIENQIERFAPGFKDCILAKNSRTTREIEHDNPNNIGGDITGGVQDLSQLFARPDSILAPYSTPIKGLYICSSSTPPGGGVHGMCGYYAACAALKTLDHL